MSSVKLSHVKPKAQRPEGVYTILIHYAITLKKVMGAAPSVEYYIDWMRRAKQKGFSVYAGKYELDKSYPPRLHFHGIATCEKNFYIKKLSQKGLHFKFVQEPNDDWTQYCEKDYTNEYEYSQMLDCNEIRVAEYPFII